MRVLIVHGNPSLSEVWGRYLERLGATVVQVQTGSDALIALQVDVFDVIVLDLVLEEGSALTIADYAHFNMPRSNVVFVTDTSFFSDGSIFAHSASARAFIETATPPEDLAEIVHYYGAGKPHATTATAASQQRVFSRSLP